MNHRLPTSEGNGRSNRADGRWWVGVTDGAAPKRPSPIHTMVRSGCAASHRMLRSARCSLCWEVDARSKSKHVELLDRHAFRSMRADVTSRALLQGCGRQVGLHAPQTTGRSIPATTILFQTVPSLASGAQVAKRRSSWECGDSQGFASDKSRYTIAICSHPASSVRPRLLHCGLRSHCDRLLATLQDSSWLVAGQRRCRTPELLRACPAASATGHCLLLPHAAALRLHL